MSIEKTRATPGGHAADSSSGGPLVSRRQAVSATLACLAVPVSGNARADEPIATWLLGTWQSDRERTMQTYQPGPQPLQGPDREKLAELFGHVFYSIGRDTFTIRHTTPVEQSASARYQVVDSTDNSITVQLQIRSQTIESLSITLYRVSRDELFIKQGRNLEYFRRVSTP